MPADDDDPEIRYRDATQMGKVYLRPADVKRVIPGLREPDQGPEADDPELTIEVWRARIRWHPGELNTLRHNQSFLAGIGNAYSDETVHAAGLLPFRRRSSLADDEVVALYVTMRKVLADAITDLRERVPPKFEKQVRDFPAVHDQGGQPSPRCGTRITKVRAGGSSPHIAAAASADRRSRPARCAGRRGPCPQGRSKTCPIRRSAGSLIALSSTSTFAVVPKRAAMTMRVSPERTLYVAL